MPNSSSNNPVITKQLGAFIAAAIARLKTSPIDNPDLDARLLIAHGLKLDRAQLLSQSDRVLTEREMKLLSVFIECRARHESVARIIGQREFWGLPFGLNEATLEPRPDSETLIETTLKNVQKDAALRILDIGTGTGCLLLSLLHALPKATGLGLDIAPRAIEQAQDNARHLSLLDRAQFKTNHWLDGIDTSFDIIISNPPYIASDVIPTLAPEVREYDPKAALDGGKDGLAAYCHLISQLPKKLNPRGLAVFEIGYDQAESVSILFQQAGFINIDIHNDLGGNPRCITASID